MKARRSRLPAFAWAAALAGMAVGGPASGDPAAPPSWRCLDFKAEAVFASASTRLCLEPAQAADLARDWRHGGGPPPPAPSAGMLRLRLDTEAMGRRTEEEIYFEPATLKMLQRSRIRLGAKGYRKSYRFEDGALHMSRSSPATEQEMGGPESGWSKYSTGTFPLPGAGCTVLSDAALLIYLASHHDWSKPAPELCVFANKHWSRVVAVAEGERDVDRRWREGGQERHAKRAQVIRLEPKPLGGEDPVELLGLSGNLRIWVDPVSRRPLLIQGRLPWVGQIDVELAAVE